MKIYISGPMTGIPEHNYPAFNKAARELRKVGYEVVNPAELDGETEIPWEDCLRRDLHEIVGCLKSKNGCKGIATLSGWKDSKGATLEVFVAKELRLPVYPVEHFLEENVIFDYVLSDKEVV